MCIHGLGGLYTHGVCGLYTYSPIHSFALRTLTSSLSPLFDLLLTFTGASFAGTRFACKLFNDSFFVETLFVGALFAGDSVISQFCGN